MHLLFRLQIGEGPMNAQDVVRQAHEANLRLVRFLYCVNGGIIRGKATHASKLSTRINEGIAQTLAIQALTGAELLVTDEVSGAVVGVPLIRAPDTIVVLS